MRYITNCPLILHVFPFVQHELYSLPLLPPRLWCVVQLVCLVRQDDITVVHHSPPTPDQRGGGVIVTGGSQGHGTPSRAIVATHDGHLSELVHPHVIHSVVVGGVGAHAAPTDWRRGAAQHTVEALSRGRAGRRLGPRLRAAVVVIEGGQHGAARRETTTGR